ncbi:hypothetical protein A2954_02960 [Candidatus Roizmanbacteria bacterium RIFCSPLOWO2_01_FULL_37_12]|uniref:Uncharacterized protein n=1 Tax=Candidatus Roizmanbacteria bacterium RIFCSPLOWO2_01_FULL_37_12 TaxID=1802056 RepID=A0A1F7IAF1_9BACT|nr:MAG: hypothetical protein A3D76_04380 [Candidatus Roizmanbacteria bacterium RIFCSPHIGHO2_02_FULL_37_9b]OGK40337.1 MAG: hypothetical protein A2954_02960 [Candidatus Roizmanbacteria bacterium RIFCSPLOWO2_01_FULL_37_12]
MGFLKRVENTLSSFSEFQRKRLENSLRRKENLIIDDPAISSGIPILKTGIEQNHLSIPDSIKSLPSDKQIAWLTSQIAIKYIPDGGEFTKELDAETLSLYRLVLAKGILQIEKPNRSLKPVAEELNIGWADCISIFYQATQIAVSTAITID